MAQFENSARRYYRHTEFVIINETLQNFYASYKSDFKEYIKDKRENYGLLFWILADVQYPYASRIIPYVTPPFNNPEKKEMFMNSSWKFRRMC